jgi:hypothetical protein
VQLDGVPDARPDPDQQPPLCLSDHVRHPGDGVSSPNAHIEPRLCHYPDLCRFRVRGCPSHRNIDSDLRDDQHVCR